jgi:nucleoside-diphosphate-sugar epimerase
MRRALLDLLNVRSGPARTGEVLCNYANIDKARLLLRLEPRTNLHDGLRKTWDWFVTHS